MKDKYEISLWDDYLVPASGSGTSLIPAHYEEKKLCVIGSNTMTAQCRAIEPKLTENVNGTNTFTFKMYYDYNEQGEKHKNPFQKLLVNERKVKVFWKDKWYDLVIKDCQEDSSSKSVTYTCKDLYINELSKTGFNLEFDTELENNQGTATELAEKILEGTDWQISDNNDIVFQKSEEAVYEAKALQTFNAKGVNPTTGADITVSVAQNKDILVFYSTIANKAPFFQFWYAGADPFVTKGSSMLVLNGQCLGVENCTYEETTTGINIKSGNVVICTLPKNDLVSLNYRANRLVPSQIQVIDPLTGKYCNVYSKGSPEVQYYSFFETEYDDVSLVTNYITNSKNFSGTTGWSGASICFTLYPDYVQGQAYEGKGYLSFANTAICYNSGIKDFHSYIKDGFTKGEKYIFRVKSMTNNGGKPSGTYCTTSNTAMRPFIGTYTYDEATRKYTKTGSSYFSIGTAAQYGDWVEFELTCVTSASYEQTLNLGFFLDNSSAQQKVWIEDIQFFKKIEGKPVIQNEYSSTHTYLEDDTVKYTSGSTTNYYRCIRKTVGHVPTNTTYWISLGDVEPTSVRINPGSYSAQSYANEVWRLYRAHQSVESVSELEYEYSGSEEGLRAYLAAQGINPKYGSNGKYEKVRSITGKQSNRFNLLQSIAETFEVWVKFTINHDSTGKTIYTNGKPEKFVSFVNEVGGRNGLCFRYGIDLKTISRTINSDAITSKLIVSQNNNQYGKDGFCTIARANDNYPKANFILNFDYYISQNLLDGTQIRNDLYSTSDGNIGYYVHLREYNIKYDEATSELIQKKNEIDKLNAKKTVLTSLINETQEKIAAVESDLARYASYSCFCEAEVKAYLDGRGANDTVAQSAWAARLGLINNLAEYIAQKANIDKAITALNNRIAELKVKQEEYLDNIAALDAQFYSKYSRFIQEGSWTSDDYYDDNLYYFDALSTSYTSSRPQISYNISVMRLSSIEQFKNKIFNLGDISAIIDTDFFGYETDGITPYREEVVISEITSNFDSPQNDEIKVQNYKTQFEDLFQRIAATTQTLQYTTGAYNNTANNFTYTGEIKNDTLQKSLEANKNLTISGDNDSVVFTKDGFVVTDPQNPAKMLKITASGIQFSRDKGEKWSGAITGTGIDPQSLTTGLLTTDKINITDGDYPTFKWDKYGLTAFAYDLANDKISNIQDGKFVRFDRFGMYGIDDSTMSGSWYPENEEAVFNKAKFGFTWNKFFMKNSYGSGYVTISSDDDFVVSDGTVKRIKIGNLGTIESPVYGISIRNEDNEEVLVTNSDGSLWLKNRLNVETTSGTVGIGKLENNKVIDANGNFIVYGDGSMVASRVTITGDGNTISAAFNGNITNGTIGNITLNASTSTIGGSGVIDGMEINGGSWD